MCHQIRINARAVSAALTCVQALSDFSHPRASRPDLVWEMSRACQLRPYADTALRTYSQSQRGAPSKEKEKWKRERERETEREREREKERTKGGGEWTEGETTACVIIPETCLTQSLCALSRYRLQSAHSI